jgi:hypothetical protein
VGLFGFACPVMGVAYIRAPLNLNRRLVPQLSLKILLDSNIRIGGQRDNNSASGSILDGDSSFVLGYDVALN